MSEIFASETLNQEQANYAGFWWRFLAFIMDAMILQIGAAVILIVLALLLGMLLIGSAQPIAPLKTIVELLGFVTEMTICWFYYAWMESSKWQGTLGKKICRLKVVKQDGSRLGFGRASVRFWARIVSFFASCMLGVLIGGVVGYFLSGCPNLFSPAGDIFDPLNFEIRTTGYLSMAIGLLIGVFAGSFLGYLPILWTGRKQAVHDLIAKTVVLKNLV